MSNTIKSLPPRTSGADRPFLYKHCFSDHPVNRFLLKGFMRAVIDLVRLTKPCSVIDIGCGVGMALRQLGTLWDDVEFLGLDIRMEFLQIAGEVAPSARYVAGSVYHLPFPSKSYDLVLCMELLEHLTDPEAALAEIARVGKAFCLFSVPHEPWWRIGNMMRGKYWRARGNTPGHRNHWGKREFIAFIKDYVDIVEVRQPLPWIVALGKIRQ